MRAIQPLSNSEEDEDLGAILHINRRKRRGRQAKEGEEEYEELNIDCESSVFFLQYITLIIFLRTKLLLKWEM